MKMLDDISSMKKLDPSGVLESTALFPDQCKHAWEEASVIKFPVTYDQIYNVVVCGMGGSRFTPRTIKELYHDRIKEPYEICEDYTLPAYVDRDTLVILSSYSGTTEEVLSCGRDALKRGAKISGVVKRGDGVVTAFLKANGATAYIFDPTYNPCGQPRIGGGYMLLGHLGLLKALKLIEIDVKEVHNAILYARSIAANYGANIPESKNPAKQLARLLKDTHPFIITAEFLKGFGNGFANQINETAKMISDYRYISELNHHMLEGLKHPQTLHDSGLFIFFSSRLYSQFIQRRFEITKNVVEKQNVRTHVIQLQGNTKAAQVLEAYVLSGFTSLYLAMLYDADPIAIPWVDYFKSQLA